MIADRYPTPITDACFDRKAQIASWMFITQHYAAQAAKDANDSVSEAQIWRMTPPDPKAVATRETYTGHEIVAFLSMLEEQYPDVAHYLHQGLTSSDLVEYALNEGTECHMVEMMLRIKDLQTNLRGMPNTPRLSRTHGQVGWLTNFRAEVLPTLDALDRIYSGMRQYPRLLKAPGPSGVYSPVNGRGFSIAAKQGRTVVASTQIIHRDHLLAWAALYLRLACTLENLALQVRLGSRTDVGEVSEGDAAKRVGSSAMPHKRNPIASEKVCGLARIARGYFMSISEGVALWESRDLSNSSAERVAVAGLAGVVEHMLETMVHVMFYLDVDQDRAARNIQNHDEHSSYLAQYVAQTVFGMGPTQASEHVREHQILHGDCPPQLTTSAPTVRRHLRDQASKVWKDLYPL